MAYFLAIDNGGTKTDYVLADETRVLARVRSGTIKRMRTDAARATANLESALAELTSISGVPLSTIERTCVGTAGNTVPLVADWLREAIPARVGGDFILVGDVEIALDAAFRGGPGVLVLAGTGSNVAGRTPDGVLLTKGGWGPALADQGSGHRIGQEALRALFLAIDEGRSTILRGEVLDFWQLGSVDELVAFANQIPSPDFSRLTEPVLRCAESRDTVAAEVLRREGESLAYLVRLMVTSILSSGEDGRQSAPWPAIAFAGSIMEKVSPVREACVAELHRHFPDLQMRDGVVDPIDGALWRARSGRSVA